jgi:hypothetical protein
MKRIKGLGIVLAAVLVLGSCGGNSTLDDTEAVVYITVDLEEWVPDIDICSYLDNGFDVTVSKMNVQSNPKAPGITIGNQQDVQINRWVITPERNDGGSSPSPQAIYDQAVFVPAGGSTDLENYRVYPVEYLDDEPLSHLLPENGGVDPETGNRNIRQRMVLQMYGRTVSGKSIASLPTPIQLNFFCGSP